jgi:hypothetical protein
MSMETDKKILLKVHFTTWILCLVFAGWFMFLFTLVEIWLHLFRSGIDWSDARLWKALFLTLIMVMLWCIAPILLSSISVTTAGFETHGIWGLRRKVRWDEITRVSLPRFGIPNDAIYIYLEDGERILVMKSMKGVGDLLQFIDAKARHAKIDDDVLPYMA